MCLGTKLLGLRKRPWSGLIKKNISVFHRFSQVSKKRTISQEIYNPGKTAGEIDQWVWRLIRCQHTAQKERKLYNTSERHPCPTIMKTDQTALVSFQTVWMFHFWVESIICLTDYLTTLTFLESLLSFNFLVKLLYKTHIWFILFVWQNNITLSSWSLWIHFLQLQNI